MSTAVEELEAPEQEQVDDVHAVEELPGAEAEAAPTQPAEIPPPPPEDAAPHFREHYDAIREKERDVYALESQYLELKEEAAGAKKAFESADKELRNLIARGPDRQRKLPLEDKPAEVRKPKRIKIVKGIPEAGNPGDPDYHRPIVVGEDFEPIIDADGDVKINDGVGMAFYLEPEEFEVIEWTNGDEQQPEPAKENDAWRKAPLTELGLTFKQNEIFESAGVKTLGDMEDLRAEIAESKAVWPKGIGPQKVTDIENRIVDWLDKNRDKFGEPMEKPTELFGQSIVPEPEADHSANGNGKAK